MKYVIATLGCKVNTYESNVMSDILENEGYTKTDENADVVIINTCSVTNTADVKSKKLIRQIFRDRSSIVLPFFKKYLVILLISIIVSIISSLLETFLFPTIVKLMIKLYK